MANYQLVDIDKLETNLANIANIVRENTGAIEALVFPDDYIRQIDTIAEDYFARAFHKELSKFINNKINATLPNAFQSGNKNLTEVSLPLMTAMPKECFKECSNLTTVNLPLVTTMGETIFNKCTSLVEIMLPSLETCEGYGNHFASCTNIETVVLPKYSGKLLPYMFNTCTKLKALVLGGDTVCQMSNANSVSSSAIGKGTGYVYVRKNLVSSYKSATNWSTYSSQIRAIEDYPEIWALLPQPDIETVTFLMHDYDLDSGEDIFEEYAVENGTTWGEWAVANGYTVLESGLIADSALKFLAPYGTTNYMTDGTITTGTYWFVD